MANEKAIREVMMRKLLPWNLGKLDSDARLNLMLESVVGRWLTYQKLTA